MSINRTLDTSGRSPTEAIDDPVGGGDGTLPSTAAALGANRTACRAALCTTYRSALRTACRAALRAACRAPRWTAQRAALHVALSAGSRTALCAALRAACRAPRWTARRAALHVALRAGSRTALCAALHVAPRAARWVIAALLAECLCFMMVAAEDLYHEENRPQFHFSPPQQWMNDPNGMVYYDGEYHLFFQYNPYANKWGPMHWGHAISEDMVHWQNLPIALFPDAHGVIYSGSAVVDESNSSGFGAQSDPPLVALFTLHDALKENLGRSDIESQGLAYSLDKGRTWIKDADNPVIANPGSRDFRDPKVFWYAPRKEWIMALAVHDHVAFYSSPDLKHWSHESDFGKDVGSHVGVWECPDLIGMNVAGGSSGRFVLLVSVGSGGPNGGSATQYFVGNFDGSVFEPEKPATPDAAAAHWLDYGTDDYAGSTWSGAKPGDERRLFLGWMSNWQYANVVPTQRWRSAMTLPRELKLVQTPNGLELHSLPVAELAALRTGSAAIARQSLTGTVELTRAAGRKPDLLELMLDLDTRKAGLITLEFSNAQGQHVSFAIDKLKRRYGVDRAASGAVDFNPAFPNPQFAPLDGAARQVSLHAYLDHSSLEIFINDGATVFTTLFFPATPYDTIKLSADKTIAVKSGVLYELKSIWDGTRTHEPVQGSAGAGSSAAHQPVTGYFVPGQIESPPNPPAQSHAGD